VVARQPKSVNSRRIHGEISESVGRALASRGVAKLGLVFPVDAQKRKADLGQRRLIHARISKIKRCTIASRHHRYY
jgi:hypothetical protein